MARKVVWGIDIGQTALRAVKGSLSGDRIEVLAFDTVEYEETLSAPDVDKDNAIQRALRTFLTRNHISSNDVVLACIPGQSALIRFIKLPPVEKKRIPDIVRYEAHQQIPFPLEEVVWDYKPLEKVYGPGEQVEVGIFAMRRDIVHGFLSNLMVCGLDVDMLQLAPMALYNFVAYDRPGGTEATIVIDMGAENTELLIYTGTSVWPRSLPISGNDFTEAIMEKFKVPFGKAETLKHMAMQSKYSKQIYQAIEPALRRLVEEVQRSVGYYKSINPGTRISGILALGGSFKLPGLGKYVSENLQHMPIRNLTDPQNFDMSVARNPRVFEESALSFGVALGLLVQGCGLAGMGISLLPQELLQRKIIARKKPWAAAVAVCALVMFGTAYTSTWRRGKELSEANSDVAKKFVDNADKLQDRYTDLTNVTVTKEKLEQIEKLWTGRDFWLYGLRKIFAPVPPEPENEKGVWYRKVVSDTVDFETVAEAMAQGVTDAFPSLGFRAKGMELEAGWREKVTSRVRKPDLQLIEFNPALGQPAKRTAPVQKIQRPDVIYMVIQGETTDLGAGVYVTNTLVKNLTNVWQCTKCKVVLRGMEPPEKCPTPDCTGTRGDFRKSGSWTTWTEWWGSRRWGRTRARRGRTSCIGRWKSRPGPWPTGPRRRSRGRSRCRNGRSSLRSWSRSEACGWNCSPISRSRSSWILRGT
jgi:type IV pilus assembly protein PilM